MIKANELRIGNWVEIGNGGYIKLESGDEFKHASLVAKPIPLTPEILERCGFEKTGLNYFIESRPEQSFLIKVYDDNSILFTIENFADRKVNVGIYKYLHQLQNIFYALTGEELTINTISPSFSSPQL